jgi:hypothetical protein
MKKRAKRGRKAAGRKSGRRGGGRRAKGEDLASKITMVLRGKGAMTIPQIVSAVKRTGYQSSSPSFARIVGMRLGDRKKFKRVKRGVYTLSRR